jgi:acetyltransferase
MESLVSAGGRSVFLRAVSAQDADAEQAFVSALSQASRYRRFHIGIRELPHSLLQALTHIDQQQHVAFVAESDDGQIVADARYVRLADSGDADFALVVSDAWQRQGLGRALLQRLMQHARAQGVQALVGDVLWDNAPMIAMVRAFGGRFTASSPPSGVMRARIAL